MALGTRQKAMLGHLKMAASKLRIPRKLPKVASGGAKESAPKGGSPAPTPVRTTKGI